MRTAFINRQMGAGYVTPPPAFVRHLGDARYGGTSTSGSLVCTISAGATIPVGEHVLVGVMLTGNPPASPPTMADSRSNTYICSINGDSATENGDATALIYITRVNTQLVAGDTITLTISPGRTSLQMSADHFKNIAAIVPLDRTAHSMTTSGSATAAWSVGPTSTLSTEPELVYVVYCAGTGGGDWLSPPDSYVRTYFGRTTGGTADREGMTLYTVAYNTTAITVSGTLAANTNWGGVVATYKGL